jgi:hypothetical protein
VEVREGRIDLIIGNSYNVRLETGQSRLSIAGQDTIITWTLVTRINIAQARDVTKEQAIEVAF